MLYVECDLYGYLLCYLPSNHLVCIVCGVFIYVSTAAMANLPGNVPQMVRTDDEILPHSKWVAIGKSNCYINMDSPQPNPIFRISLDILRQTSFFRAFTAAATIPAIYIQQFWNTIGYDKVTGKFHCQLDEQTIEISKTTLGSALQIIPVSDESSYTSPPNP